MPTWTNEQLDRGLSAIVILLATPLNPLTRMILAGHKTLIEQEIALRRAEQMRCQDAQQGLDYDAFEAFVQTLDMTGIEAE